MMQLGYQFAAKLHEDGKFSNFELAEILLQESGHIQEVMVPEHSGGCEPGAEPEDLRQQVQALREQVGDAGSITQVQLSGPGRQ